MKRLFLSLFYIFLFFCAMRAGAQTPVDELITVIQGSAKFDLQKENTIKRLKDLLNGTNNIQLYRQFEISSKLYEEYKSYQNDSAYGYAKKLQALSQQMGNQSLAMLARIKLGFTMLSSGMYKEAEDSLLLVNVKIFPDSIKAEYFALMARYYYDLSDFDSHKYYTPLYNATGTAYVDSALALWRPDSYEFLYYSGLKEVRTGNKTKAFENFNKLLQPNTLTLHQVALTASTLSDLYIQKGENEKVILLLAKAVVADVKSSTKETAAAFNLATLLYKKGDIKNASICINQALADAVFYSARQRKMQVSAVLPLIEAAKFDNVEKQKKMLILYGASVTFLLLVVVTLVIVVLQQVKRLKTARNTISEVKKRT